MISSKYFMIENSKVIAIALVLVAALIIGMYYLVAGSASPTVTTSSSSSSVPTSTSSVTIPPQNFSIAVYVDDFGYVPKTIKIQQGQRIVLTLYNIGTVPHDLYIPGMNVNTSLVQPGQNTTIAFFASGITYNFTFYSTTQADISANIVGELDLLPPGQCAPFKLC